MKNIIIISIIVLFISCDSEFNYPNECEQYNINIAREYRIKKDNAMLEYQDNPEKLEKKIELLNEQLSYLLQDCN